MKKQLLLISPFVAYKNIKHAGGKTHYYYVSKLENNYEITSIASAKESERKDIELTAIQSKQSFVFYLTEKISLLKKIRQTFCARNPFDKYAGFIDYDMLRFAYKTACKLKKNNYTPEIIILDFTQCIFLAKKIRRLFPNAHIISVEQDVTFLKYERFIKDCNSFLKKIIRTLKYHNIKMQELASLNQTDEIITFNNKDKNLLENKIHKGIMLRTISPYFDNYNICRKKISSTIIYFGAMSRPENYKSALWFIEKVLPMLPATFNFIIIGNSPAKELTNLNNPRVKITGFVHDIRPYFETALCFAAPIVMGAGIKIKILEAMSAGLSVLTNEIGIEGISAEKDKDFIYCTTPKDYAEQIEKLYADVQNNLDIGENARKFIHNNFNYDNCSYIQESL